LRESGGAAAEEGEEAEWTPYDLGLLQQAARLLGPDPCQVCLALYPPRFSCFQVKRRLDALLAAEEDEEAGGGGGGGGGEDAGGRGAGKRGAARRRKKVRGGVG
jgi:hypothetical protein